MRIVTLAQKIKMHRKALGLTQTELGEKLDVEKNAVSKWECGRVENIRVSKIKKMAEIFGVSFSYLIDDSAELGEKETAAQGDGFSEFDKELLKFFHAQSPEKIRAFLTLGGAPKNLLDAFDRAQDGEG